jgi:hypothetical protein
VQKPGKLADPAAAAAAAAAADDVDNNRDGDQGTTVHRILEAHYQQVAIAGAAAGAGAGAAAAAAAAAHLRGECVEEQEGNEQMVFIGNDLQ